MADREQVVKALRLELNAATDRRRAATENLERVIEAIAGRTDAESLQRLLQATREHSKAEDAFREALLRLNYVLGLDEPPEEPGIKPSSGHEREITRIVDKIATEGRLSPTAVDEVIAALDFPMSRSETEFLVKYLLWRMDNPTHKE